MVKGYLKIFVLKSLLQAPSSGYGLMKSVGSSMGKRPSPGSMYPLLEELVKSGLITVKRREAKNSYAITKKGRAAISRFLKEKDILIQQHVKLWRSVTAIGGMVDPKETMVCDGVFERNFDLVHELRELLVKSMRADVPLADEKKARNIIEKAIRDLRRIPWGS